jgi:tRNA (mo5U34)-methyltransferase
MSNKTQISPETDPREELENLLNEITEYQVWRPIFDDQDQLVHEGHADIRDGHPDFLSKVDFKGRSVLDVGCNFGYHSFLARQLGAARVVGIDQDPRPVEGGKLLCRIHNLDRMTFIAGDFFTDDLGGPFDIGLMINFFGKARVLRGVQHDVDALKKHCREAMVITAACAYSVDLHCQGDAETLLELYGRDYVRDGNFYLNEFLKDYLADEWEMTLLSPEFPRLNVKRTLLFRRKK